MTKLVKIDGTYKFDGDALEVLVYIENNMQGQCSIPLVICHHNFLQSKFKISFITAKIQISYLHFKESQDMGLKVFKPWELV